MEPSCHFGQLCDPGGMHWLYRLTGEVEAGDYTLSVLLCNFSTGQAWHSQFTVQELCDQVEEDTGVVPKLATLLQELQKSLQQQHTQWLRDGTQVGFTLAAPGIGSGHVQLRLPPRGYFTKQPGQPKCAELAVALLTDRNHWQQQVADLKEQLQTAQQLANSKHRPRSLAAGAGSQPSQRATQSPSLSLGSQPASTLLLSPGVTQGTSQQASYASPSSQAVPDAAMTTAALAEGQAAPAIDASPDVVVGKPRVVAGRGRGRGRRPTGTALKIIRTDR
ncbi:hypothetical protein WJX72_009497 [[Myrmecia] bisecta]|uniref:Uncharacterized protein n=1 Tax=[Myrmecia] bisecta TaxID=41462 RepID=A0AAW1QS80_9CHLO